MSFLIQYFVVLKASHLPDPELLKSDRLLFSSSFNMKADALITAKTVKTNKNSLKHIKQMLAVPVPVIDDLPACLLLLLKCSSTFDANHGY